MHEVVFSRCPSCSTDVAVGEGRSSDLSVAYHEGDGTTTTTIRDRADQKLLHVCRGVLGTWSGLDDGAKVQGGAGSVARMDTEAAANDRVAQASGMVSVQAECTVDEALEMIRDRALASRATFYEIAAAVVERRIRFG